MNRFFSVRPAAPNRCFSELHTLSYRLLSQMHCNSKMMNGTLIKTFVTRSVSRTSLFQNIIQEQLTVVSWKMPKRFNEIGKQLIFFNYCLPYTCAETAGKWWNFISIFLSIHDMLITSHTLETFQQCTNLYFFQESAP